MEPPQFVVEVLERMQGELKYYLGSRTDSDQDAEDLISQIKFEALRKIYETGDENMALVFPNAISLEHWLRRVAKVKCWKYYRDKNAGKGKFRSDTRSIFETINHRGIKKSLLETIVYKEKASTNHIVEFNYSQEQSYDTYSDDLSVYIRYCLDPKYRNLYDLKAEKLTYQELADRLHPWPFTSEADRFKFQNRLRKEFSRMNQSIKAIIEIHLIDKCFRMLNGDDANQFTEALLELSVSSQSIDRHPAFKFEKQGLLNFRRVYQSNQNSVADKLSEKLLHWSHRHFVELSTYKNLALENLVKAKNSEPHHYELISNAIKIRDHLRTHLNF